MNKNILLNGSPVEFAIVVKTQYVENYGAHSWDGKGECPQHWKFKGGSDFWVLSTKGEYPSEDALTKAQDLVRHESEYSREYPLSVEVLHVSEAERLVALGKTEWWNGDEKPVEVRRA